MGANKVLETTKRIIAEPQYVTIDSDRVDLTAKIFAQEDLRIPSENKPIFLDGNSQATIDFLLIGHSINFAYTDFDTGIKYAKEFMNTEWSGAFGMWAALKKAIQDGVPLLDGNYLRQISEDDLKNILEGNIEIPLFSERLKVFREVGQVLCEKYDGHFYNLVDASNNRLFNEGKGLVERLVTDFSAFDDSVIYKGEIVRFDKKAQLGASSLYKRFRNQCAFPVTDVNELTVFSDYILPKALRDLGILKYEDSLAKRVDNWQIIEAGSQEELEIRASTIHASKMLQDRINMYRNDNPINALHIDYKLWHEFRNKKGPHHLTKTIAY